MKKTEEKFQKDVKKGDRRVTPGNNLEKKFKNAEKSTLVRRRNTTVSEKVTPTNLRKVERSSPSASKLRKDRAGGGRCLRVYC